MNKKNEWIIFDFDGTLVNSMSVMKKSFSMFMKSKNLKFNDEDFKRLDGPTLNEIISYLKKKYRLKEKETELYLQYDKIIQENFKDVKLFPGRKKLLRNLKDKDYHIGLVTSAKENIVFQYIKNNNIHSIFDSILCGDKIKKSKPNPEIYEKFLSNINKPKTVIVLEDSENGIKSARKVGLNCINVKNKTSSDILSLIEKSKQHSFIAKGDIVVNLKKHNLVFSKEIKGEIARIWKELKNKNNSLFDSKSPVVIDIKKNKTKTTINVFFTDYKTILADRKKPKLGIKVNQLGVSGVILLNDNKLVFAKRGKFSTEYPGMIELVPSGNIDISDIKDNKIDYISKIKKEFEEEIGISNKQILEVKPLGIVKDNKNKIYDICCRLKIRINENEFLQKFQNSTEYTKPFLIDLKEINTFHNKNIEKIIPTSNAVIEYFCENFK
ncbi:MAG: HAD family hydrolase [Nitrosopumilus sp.]|uniref:HAD family hydrolase n=1 Tax=Nitrosopumilus sp. TaxID=2024843 RepID=UPI00247B7818|nr:HAD-IA family hydrolase [Nitrosopumilus sp.]MCV0393554.1 HAD family hydrolase [Nitrosopumilus sp.]